MFFVFTVFGLSGQLTAGSKRDTHFQTWAARAARAPHPCPAPESVSSRREAAARLEAPETPVASDGQGGVPWLSAVTEKSNVAGREGREAGAGCDRSGFPP